MWKYNDVTGDELDRMGAVFDLASSSPSDKKVVNDEVPGSLVEKCRDFARRRRTEADYSEISERCGKKSRSLVWEALHSRCGTVASVADDEQRVEREPCQHQSGAVSRMPGVGHDRAESHSECS